MSNHRYPNFSIQELTEHLKQLGCPYVGKNILYLSPLNYKGDRVSPKWRNIYADFVWSTAGISTQLKDVTLHHIDGEFMHYRETHGKVFPERMSSANTFHPEEYVWSDKVNAFVYPYQEWAFDYNIVADAWYKIDYDKKEIYTDRLFCSKKIEKIE